MASISQLRSILLFAFTSGGLQNGEQEFFEELMAHKPYLINLYDVGIRNSQAQRELEAGTITVNGRSVAVNADFARQAIFLSQQLDCSERYIVGLLQDIMEENPNVPPEQCIEATILEFHLRRRQLADCIRYVLEAAEVGETSDSPALFVRLDQFVRQHLLPPPGGAGTGLSFPMRIFQEIHNLDNVLAKAQAARQSAKTHTVAPSAHGAPSLGADILSARCDSLKYERRTLATALYFIGHMGYIGPADIPRFIDWLDSNPRHPMSFYVLSTVLAIFDLVQPESPGGRARSLLTSDKSFMSYMKRKLDVHTSWKEPGLKATILLKWTLLLTETRRRSASLEDAEGFKTEELETQIWNAVQGECFTYLLHLVAQLQKKQTVQIPTSFAAGLLAQMEQEQLSELPSEDFKSAILEACEVLIRSLITQASSELRKIRQRQEDLLLAGTRTDRTRFRSSHTQSSRFTAGSSSEPEKPNTPPRNDMAVLFSLIGVLYSTLPAERALHFWGAGNVLEGRRSTHSQTMESNSGKLPAFLQWAVWSTQARDVDMLMALYDMLNGLANGQHCSELAYNFLARGGGDVVPGSSLPSAASQHLSMGPVVSWGAIFALLDSWVAASSVPRANPGHPQGVTTDQHGLPVTQSWQSQSAQHPPQQLAFTQQDVLHAQAFLRLLSTVVAHSVAVRATISGHARFRAIPTLVSLIPLGIPLELKGAIFDTLASFCLPGAGTAGVEICRTVWTLMERMEVINMRVNQGIGHSLPAIKGVEVELDEVESVYKMYPATIPFLNLLTTLIHTPKGIALRERIAEAEPINTIPETLGHPYRQPGIGPFASFVIDNVFARINAREYLRPSDRWRTNDLCLCFVERCLASYDLESLVANVDELQPKGDSLLQLALHPGYDIMKRLLTPSPLQNSILSYLVEGLDGFDRGLAEEEPYFRNTIVRVLRIVHRVLEVQDIFLDVLLPTLSESNDTSIIGEISPASYFIRFDHALSYTAEHIPAVAAYIAYPAYPELMLLSVKIVTALASSPSFPQLALLIDRSDESVRILDGYQNVMDLDVSEDVEAAENIAEQTTGAGAPDIDGPSDALVQAIRLAILDLFNQNTHPGRPYPNVAHFILFGGSASQYQIQDPHALGARRSCIHSILELLSAGIPRLKGKGRQRRHDSSSEPLFAASPAFAERCYRVILQLCQHPRTSESFMRYLRTHEDFFARHLAAIPFKVPAAGQQSFIEVMYNDGTRVTTTVNNLAAFLQLRSWILDLVALELHVLTNKGHHKSVAELLELLFGNEEDYLEDGTDGWGTEIFKPFHEMGQSHLRIIEFLQSLDFDWSDSLAVQAVELQFLNQLNLQSCLKTDGSGCEIVDSTALLSLLTVARRMLHMQNRIITPMHLEQLIAETSYVMESCAIENHRRKVRHASANGYAAWGRLLDMCLVKCFERLPHDRRENMLFDLLHVIPLTLRLANLQESTAVLLAGVMLSTITKLREDRHHQVILQSAGSDVEAGSLPAERLQALLRSILECIIENGQVELVRGNLYASLVNYLHLITHTVAESEMESIALSASLSASASRDDLSISDGMSAIVPLGPGGQSLTSSSPIIRGSADILKTVMERLVAIVSRDAIDGTEVWKTIAFLLLDALVRLSRLDKHPIVLQALSRHGFLAGFVSGLKESDLLLQAVLKPDPDDLNPLYVYEGKMSLLIRMSQSRQGAERLLETRVIPVLADCDFLDAQPETDQAFIDNDSFLPSAIQRYHQLFIPTLQLVVGMLVTLGSRHTTAANQALQFLSSHRDTVIILFKNGTDELSLSVLEELRLLVSLSANVLELVPKSELISHSGFGAIHSAILGLAARCMSSRHWSDRVRPQTEAELSDVGIIGPGFNSETKFRAAVHQQDRLLRRAIIGYLGAASDFADPELTLVLSPAVSLPKQEERPSRVVATVPTVGDAIEALDCLCDDLTNSLKQIIDLSAELDSRDYIKVDNLREIVPVADSSLLDSLDMRQKQSLISQELDRWRVQAKRKVQVTLNALEMLLLLIWRHLVFYCEGRHINNPDLKGSISHAMRFALSPDVETLTTESARKILPVLQRLQTLELTEETLGRHWQSYESYVEIMSRRLSDTVGLHDEPEDVQNGQ